MAIGRALGEKRTEVAGGGAEEGTAAAGAGNKVERWRAGAVGVAVTRVAGQQQGIEWRSSFWGIQDKSCLAASALPSGQ